MRLLDHTPGLSNLAATSGAKSLYGVQVSATPLSSERDQNFLLTTDDGEKFVLKIANALEERSMLEAQNAALDHLGKQLSLCPRVVPNLKGESI